MDTVPDQLFSTEEINPESKPDEGDDTPAADSPSEMMKIDLMSEAPEQIFAEDKEEEQEVDTSENIAPAPTEGDSALAGTVSEETAPVLSSDSIPEQTGEDEDKEIVGEEDDNTENSTLEAAVPEDGDENEAAADSNQEEVEPAGAECEEKEEVPVVEDTSPDDEVQECVEEKEEEPSEVHRSNEAVEPNQSEVSIPEPQDDKRAEESDSPPEQMEVTEAITETAEILTTEAQNGIEPIETDNAQTEPETTESEMETAETDAAKAKLPDSHGEVVETPAVESTVSTAEVENEAAEHHPVEEEMVVTTADAPLPDEESSNEHMVEGDTAAMSDLITPAMMTPSRHPQVFAEIIEEEIIEEETVEVLPDGQVRTSRVSEGRRVPDGRRLPDGRRPDERKVSDGRRATIRQSDEFIAALTPGDQHPRRLQAREDAAKRKDESMLISTRKIIDSTDDVLRSAQALLKSTSEPYKDSDEIRERKESLPLEDRVLSSHVQHREKKNYKRKKMRVDMKEKEVDPDYDAEDDFNDKAFLSPKDNEAAAFASRLPADRMTKQEAISFPDIATANKDIHQHFLYIRNRLLYVWLEDPKQKLTVEIATPRIEPPHGEDMQLIQRVYEYLYRYGFVNFGIYTSKKPVAPAPGAPKVIIIGAGISGLTAARQLHEFGLNVEIIEARPVVGGRICTYRDGPHVADLGAKVVTGLGGNPLAVIAKQLDLDLLPIKQDCPLYEFTGQMVPKDRDERVEREFNRLLEATTYMSHQLNVNSINGRPVSLGQALEIIIKLQIRQVKEKQIKHGRERCEIQDKLNHIQQALFPLHEKIKDSHSKYLELKMKHEELSDQLGEVIRDQKAEFEVKAAYKTMLETFGEYDSLLKEQQELEVKLTKMEQMVPNEIYMTPQERHVLDWHCANLEFANAAPLSALSLKHWDQDDDFEFTGNHLIIREGMSTIADNMTKDLDIKFNTACIGIKYTEDGVEIATREVNKHNNSWTSNSTTTLHADAVLLTIPLGVLKKEKVKFEPALPEWKTSAIKRMGFGNLNKVVLCFNKVFWDPSIHLFGHVSNSTISRGELFLFWSIAKAPVLIALIAGEAATVIETVPDEAIVGRAMTILRAIFGFQTVPQPSKHRVTRWRGDPWALGSYSYVAAGSSGNDYDDLARPVTPPNSMSGAPKLFFAGEHTIRNYPATVHGALLSGLREAGRITDQYLGPPYAKETVKEAVEDS